MFQSSEDLLAYIKKEGVEFVDVRFCDLPGIQQHFSVPVSSFGEEVFTDGLMFDGSSIRGFQAIHESDMSLMPDPTTAYIDPFRRDKTLALSFFIHDPLTGEAYSRDPRNIARKAEAYLRSTGIGDTAFFAPEAEFYVFDDVRFETKANAGYYSIDSVAGAWNTGREEEGGNQGYKVRYKGGYFPVSPVDHFADLRAEMSKALEAAGLLVERQHHEVGHCRSGGDQLPVQLAARRRRRRHEVQVHHPQRGLPGRQDGDLHAQADLRRQRVRHALPPVAVG
jgi:glutamine synthetase